MTMDRERHLHGACWGFERSEDLPDFRTRMCQQRGQAPLRPDAPLEYREVAASIARGSDATSLDELPRCVLRFCTGPGIAGVCSLLNKARSGQPSRLLNSVLHIPLRKKEPSWLLRNSRPVLLEPFIRRLEATIAFRRFMHHLESTGGLPSSMFAYRRQLPPQEAALLLRWLIAYWVSCGVIVSMADWYEINAYCNIPRAAAGPLLDLLCEGFGAWMRQYYSDFRIHVAQGEMQHIGVMCVPIGLNAMCREKRDPPPAGIVQMAMALATAAWRLHLALPQ